jgi:hypothetical protein
MRSLLKCSVLAGAGLLASCASTSFVSTWKAPDAQSLRGEGKVVTVVMTQNEAMRRGAEDSLAQEITKMGAQAVPGYTLIQNEPTETEANAKEALEKAGVGIVVTMRPTGVSQEISSSPTASATYWGGGYYGYGWGAAYGPSMEIHTDTIVHIQTLVYSLKQNKLVWSGQSKTTNPGNVDSLVKEIIYAVADEMKKGGLI